MGCLINGKALQTSPFPGGFIFDPYPPDCPLVDSGSLLKSCGKF